MAESELDQPVEERVIGEIVRIPLDSCQPDPANPNVEDLATFNELVAEIRNNGFLSPLVVRPQPESQGMYWIVRGEHRWKAAKQLGYMELPVVVKADWDDVEARIQLVRDNLLHGKIDPARFQALWKQLVPKVPGGEDALRKKMGFGAKDTMLRGLLKEATRGLPEHIRAEVAKRADKIRRVEDLAAVVQSLFAKFGGTMQQHYVLFSFGGQVHLMVQADAQTFAPVRALAELCHEKNVQFDVVLAGIAAAVVEQGLDGYAGAGPAAETEDKEAHGG